ncbi:YdeI family protein [Rubellimicrobium sp. CFH 75288]|uniref:YdeI/OmpD-associated family protein n=1 Tax=Rubellimicrobium sp. CFH 75288 TaxID=2697034 RepID=UPI0014125555|nr:YdeI/OmpD-associated family protein [Rubellimicrobium sp. CFH 75288]NAZ37467.1 hypothetical protein [Rubellimicrobium sp. CFH 75288]
MIATADEYFASGCGRCARFATPDCSARRWAGGLAELRRLCLAAGLSEAVRWGHPCYRHAGRNVAIIGAFRDDFRLSLFDAVLLPDAEGVLERQGPNTRHADAFRFRSNDGPAQRAEAILACLRAAMDMAERGLRAPKAEGAPDLPDELVAALDADPALAEAFAALTPGRQRSYAVALSSARTAATRIARIARFRDRILAGKGATER